MPASTTETTARDAPRPHRPAPRALHALSIEHHGLAGFARDLVHTVTDALLNPDTLLHPPSNASTPTASRASSPTVPHFPATTTAPPRISPPRPQTVAPSPLSSPTSRAAPAPHALPSGGAPHPHPHASRLRAVAHDLVGREMDPHVSHVGPVGPAHEIADALRDHTLDEVLGLAHGPVTVVKPPAMPGSTVSASSVPLILPGTIGHIPELPTYTLPPRVRTPAGER
ncbi:hypothetical protein AMAG_02433 [Allomyces macrogynus ATCC 38327]|uniref:Uncharacterized protein n=1 Tax=Allomyces macrogynus (strain ATCC 38327) TaxID=578462 RepID=A0A0L0S266_ALLM3|nr:hypothetical protein AMAG_02433 [Allomyces macrogynus ATCC 38327]|eukprot:KNE56648.1 hypothetical protein AMAG_02433 [Allomyces macrogynus ATCC 38327]